MRRYSHRVNVLVVVKHYIAALRRNLNRAHILHPQPEVRPGLLLGRRYAQINCLLALLLAFIRVVIIVIGGRIFFINNCRFPFFRLRLIRRDNQRIISICLMLDSFGVNESVIAFF